MSPRYLAAMLRNRMPAAVIPASGVTRHRLRCEPLTPAPYTAAPAPKRLTVQQERSLENQARIRIALKNGYTEPVEIADQCALSLGQTHFALRLSLIHI